LDPLLLPEKKATGLTSAMSTPIASQTLQMHTTHDTAHTPWFMTRIAGLVRPFEYPGTLPTILKHLWHERYMIQAPAVIKSCKNLFLTPDFDPFSRPQITGHF
jgi:hypothetical protein